MAAQLLMYECIKILDSEQSFLKEVRKDVTELEETLGRQAISNVAHVERLFINVTTYISVVWRFLLLHCLLEGTC